jgi:hypothetical protein
MQVQDPSIDPSLLTPDSSRIVADSPDASVNGELTGIRTRATSYNALFGFVKGAKRGNDTWSEK